MTDPKTLARQLREDALALLDVMKHDGERIAARMREAADVLDAFEERAPEPPAFND